MKIYDKTLPEIFQDIPLSYKIMMVCCALFIALTIVYVPYVYVTYGDKDKTVPPLLIDGHEPGVLGNLDPSIAFNGRQHALAYTALSTPNVNTSDLRTEVFLAVARNMGKCVRWRHSSIPFATRAETLIGPDGSTPVTRGFWRIETPALVYDPDDKGKEWKLYAYKYFWAGKVDLARLYGAIVYRYTSDITGSITWSTEEWILGAGEQSPPFPYSQVVQNNLDTLDPSLKSVYFFSRPSVVYVDKTIVMSLSAFVKGKQTPDRIIMIASKDHGKTWHYLGTPLRHDMIGGITTEINGQKQNYTLLQGASLILQDGIPYLAAVLGNKDIESNGTFIFGFDNISSASLIKDAKGGPALLNYIPLNSGIPTNVGGGYATYHQSCKETGLITSEMSGIRRTYSIFRTDKPALPEK